MKHAFAEKKKVFYDFTKQDDRARIEALEEEVARLNDALTVLIMGGKNAIARKTAQ